MARGGTRWGAGRPAHRLKAEDAVSLNVNYLSQNGYLDEGNWKRLLWRLYGKEFVNGLIRAYEHHITVDLGPNTHWLFLTHTPCHLGGQRRWFVCPNCKKRSGILYLRTRCFGCRTCQKISYQSQSGDAEDRVVWTYHTLYDKVFNWKSKRAARFNRTYAKFINIAEQFEELVDRRLHRVAMADGGL